MNSCSDYHDLLVAYIEGLLDDASCRDIELHVARCSSCRAKLDEYIKLNARIKQKAAPFSRKDFDVSVMNKILEAQTVKLRRQAMWKRYGKAGLGLAAAAAIAFALFTGWGIFGTTKLAAADVFMRGIQAVSNLHTVHIKARMRTIAHDNFDLIGINYDFVEHDLWKEFGDPPKWRIEKPGRVVVMDGKSSVLLIRPKMVARGGPDVGFVSWLKPVLDVDKVLERELQVCREKGWKTTVDYKTGSDGLQKLIVTVEACAEGDFTNDWCKNRSIIESDNRRVYQFDTSSQLLENLQVYVHNSDQDVLVFEITKIEYNVDLDPSLFKLELPEDTVTFQKPAVLDDNENYQCMTPDETARAFFQACSDEKWDEVLKFWPMSKVDQRIKDYLGGIQIISIGAPFKSGLYPGWFVPYEIKFKSGATKKMNLAVRNDNKAGRYVVDGGI
jgi:outer membrane lipoprotein-sorting protein